MEEADNVNEAIRPQPAGGLIIGEGYAEIPAWGWNSSQRSILGIPVLVDVNRTIRDIRDGSHIKPSLHLTFPNGWVLALNTPFSDFLTEDAAPVFGTAYIGEANHVFDLESVRNINRPLSDLSVLEATILEIANLPFADRYDLIEKFIAADPHHPGIADAVIADSGVHVWALMGAFLLRDVTVDEAAYDYEISREAVLAGLAYYRQYRPIIIARIAANNLGAA
jgi:uncharacterized protein (DUF433 family)